jgi:hypothetical protein
MQYLSGAVEKISSSSAGRKLLSWQYIFISEVLRIQNYLASWKTTTYSSEDIGAQNITKLS